MSDTTLDVTAITAEADAVASLHELNAHYIRAFVESDTDWYREHLSDDFVCTLANGRRIDKEEFLQKNAAGPGVTGVSYDEIDVRPLGDTALVHGVTHYTGAAHRGRRATRTSGTSATAAGRRSPRSSPAFRRSRRADSGDGP